MGPDDITTDWISSVLGEDIATLRHERIGDGLVGLNLRVHLDPAVTGSSVPSSVVMKLPSLDPTSRATGIALRNYEREVKFYDHIAATVDIRVPHCWHADWDAETGDFVLVLEDMAPARQGDQIAGCSVDTAFDAVRELAKLHGPRWDDPTLFDHEFLQRRSGQDDVDQISGLWNMFFPGFQAVYAKYLSPEAEALVEAFGPQLGTWMDGRTGAMTVTHGDYRLDNLLFATPDGGPPVTAVDWQTPGHGPPIADLAYFCGAGLLPDERRLAERDLVDAYVDALVAQGVEVERSWVWEHYCRDAFAGVVMAVVASQVVGGSERSEAMFAAMATRHLQHALDVGAFDLLS
ncbi:MAG: phosphotransferase family protein [Ilumatobacter sp.]|uniref:phosphotransferase family protein n=1 Tax=Ilumatobacter sp. TaxID=1967498 RepID=UPI00391CB9B0